LWFAWGFSPSFDIQFPFCSLVFKLRNAAAEAQIKQAESANVEQYFTALAQELLGAV